MLLALPWTSNRLSIVAISTLRQHFANHLLTVHLITDVKVFVIFTAALYSEGVSVLSHRDYLDILVDT